MAAAPPALLLVVAVALARPLTPRVDPLPTGEVTAVVPLASALTPDALLDGPGTERLLVALQLTRRYPGSRIITTRLREGLGDQAGIIGLTDLEPLWSVAPGIVETTRDEALAIRSILPPGARVIVVTSPAHTGRACAAFEQVGLSVSCVEARSRRRSLYTRLRANVYERLALMKYRRQGWIP
jgi:uncharacterized SAM-binding protein YcdF (DUF218 family)